MIGYTPTPDYYNEYIQHGYLKDAAAKVHKYIDRWRGKNGKWYYRYKSKAYELGTKIRRKLNKAEANEISWNKGKELGAGYVYDTGKPGGYRYTNNRGGYSIDIHSNYKKGIEAGRKRAKKKATTERFNKHMASKSVRKGGYSGSRGTKASNKASTAGMKKSNGYQYIMTNNYGRDVNKIGDIENIISSYGRSLTGQRGSRLNAGLAAGRKRTGNNKNNQNKFVASKTNRKSKAYVSSKKKNSKSRKYVTARTRRANS